MSHTKQEMKQHIKKQMKEFAKKCASAFQSSPLGGECSFTIRREETMECEEYDAQVNTVVKEWDSKYQHRLNESDWSRVINFYVNYSTQHDVCDSKGMPLEWDVEVEWETEDLVNLFE